MDHASGGVRPPSFPFYLSTLQARTRRISRISQIFIFLRIRPH